MITLTPTHLCFKLLLNIDLIFIVVFSAFASLNGSVTIATKSSSHNSFFKVTLCKQHIVPTPIVYSDNNRTAPILLLLELSSPFQTKHFSYAPKCPTKLSLMPVWIIPTIPQRKLKSKYMSWLVCCQTEFPGNERHQNTFSALPGKTLTGHQLSNEVSSRF